MTRALNVKCPKSIWGSQENLYPRAPSKVYQVLSYSLETDELIDFNSTRDLHECDYIQPKLENLISSQLATRSKQDKMNFVYPKINLNTKILNMFPKILTSYPNFLNPSPKTSFEVNPKPEMN